MSVQKKNQTPRRPYSYHTFIFPFLYQDGSKKTSRMDFAKCLHSGFKPDVFKEGLQNDDTVEYARYRYFNQAARNAIYSKDFDGKDDNHNVVWNYSLDLNIFTPEEKLTEQQAKENHTLTLEMEKRELQICKDSSQEEKGSPHEDQTLHADESEKMSNRFKKNMIFKASLRVNGIRVKLFDSGVGMLIFELENYDLPSERDVTKINEYGRRVFRPFVDLKKDILIVDDLNNTEIKVDEYGDCSLCADSLTLKYGETAIIDGVINGSKVDGVYEIKLSPIIKYLFTNKENKTCISTRIYKSHGKQKDHASEGCSKDTDYTEFCIEPLIDDRMFVACVYNSKSFVRDVCAWDFEQKQYHYISDATTMELTEQNAARRFYELVFIDGNGLTCQNRTMLRDMNRAHSYARWIEYGTLMGISEYSMVSITGDEIDVYNINPFLTEYVEMVILVLAQRASLLAFERAISDVTCKNISKLDIEEIHRKYVAFESELLITEVTSQQQGIEIYDILLKNLMIEKLKKDLDTQINSLYELHTADHEGRENKLLNFLAVIGAAEIFGNLGSDLVNAFLSKFCENPPTVSQWPFTVGIGVVGMITLWLIGRHSKSVK